MFATVHAKEKDKKFNAFFEYTDIDADMLKQLSDLQFSKKKTEQTFTKWIINLEREIAFIHLEYVTAGIVRGNDNECYEKYAFIVQGGYGIISTYYMEHCPDRILSTEVKFFEMEEDLDVSSSEISELLREVIRVYQEGRHLEWTIDDKRRSIDRLKNTRALIMHGSLSDKMQNIINSVTEVKDMELRFRRICMIHFIEYNVR